MPDETLCGLSIAVPRFSKEGETFSEKLIRRGAAVHLTPLIRLAPRALSDADGERTILDHFLGGAYDWVMISSVHGVRAFAALIRAHRLGELVTDADWLKKTIAPELTWPSQTSLLVVGPTTAKEATEALFTPHLVAEHHTAEGMLEALLTRLQGKERLLVVRGSLGRDVLDKELRRRGFAVDVLVAYENVPDEAGIERLSRLIEQNALDVITLTSPSTAEGFHRARLIARDRMNKDLPPLPAVTIGPITTERAKALGLWVMKEAEPYTEEGLISALEEIYPELIKR